MKTRTILALALVLVTSSVVMAASVTPVYWPKCGPGVQPPCIDTGDAAYECGQIGDYEFAYKVDNPAENGDYGPEDGQTITIWGSDGYQFNWDVSPYPLGAVMVKAGTGYLVYEYASALGDTELVAPEGKQVSHVSFCWNISEMCYEEETAWAEGDRYVKRGNWAMYVDYYGEEKTVRIIADYSNYVDIGTATFSAPDEDGMVTITINLTGGAIFYYDLNDPYYDDNLKIQDYDAAPKKTPRPGRFAWKWQIPTGATTATVTVPLNNFYGVHMDVALPVPCP